MNLPISIEQNATHFVPAKESIRILVSKVPPGKRVVKMTLTIKDRDEKTVHQVQWPQGSEKGVPPTSFVWDGANSQVSGCVTPLGSPYDISVDAELADLQKPSKPQPDVLRDMDPVTSCPKSKSCGITELVVGGVSARSTSYSYHQEGIDKLVIPGGKQGRFFLAPGADKDIKITYKLVEPGLVDRGRLALFNRHGALVWEKQLTGPFDVTGKLDASPIMEQLRVADAPYKLKLNIAGQSLLDKRHVAWTYIDVAVESIQLSWGSARLLLPRTPTGAAIEEIILLRRLKGLKEPGKRDLSVLLSEDDAAGEKAVDTKPNKIELSSSFFYQSTEEWANDTASSLYRGLWGDGPRLPIVAKVLVRSAEGKAVEAPSALRGAKLLWDWEDPQPDKKGTGETKEWLAWATERFGHKGDAHSPPSTNCHVAYGGKRGEGAPPVFPQQNGTDAFPFRVEGFGQRRPWAALSAIGDDKAGKWASMTGVIFQPSRIAGDTYRVCAYLYTGDEADFDHSETALSKAALVAGLPLAKMGTLEVWRRVEILRYIKKGAGPDVDLAQVNNYFAPAKLKLVMAVSDDPKVVDKLFDTGLKSLLGKAKGSRESLKSIMTPLDQQKDCPYLIKLKSWDEFASGVVLDALDQHIASLKSPADKEARDRFSRARGQIDSQKRRKWCFMHSYLSPDDCAQLTSATSSVFGRQQSIVSMLPIMAIHLAGYNVRTTTKNLLVDLVKDYSAKEADLSADKTPLGGHAGLFVVHVGAMYPGLHDLSGSAMAMGRGGEERGRGLLFVAYPSVPDDVVVVDPTGQGNRSDFPPHNLPITISGDFRRDYSDDFAALLTCVAHGAVFRAAKYVVDSGGTGDPAKALAGKGHTLRVQSRNAGLVDLVKKEMALHLGVPKIQTSTHDHGDRDIYLTTTPNLDRSNTTRLTLGVWKETPGNTSKRRICEFVRNAYDRGYLHISTLYVHYKRKSKRAERRKDAVVAQLGTVLKAVIGCIDINPGPKDSERPRVYDINALFAHEIGHTIFLPHAPPEAGEQPWRHVTDYVCLMNYDPTHSELCGACQLALRGWDIGTNSRGKLSDGPAWRKTKEPPDTVPAREIVEDRPPPLVLPPAPVVQDPGWEHAGYHGTSSIHYASLSQGLRAVGAKWDSESGGELGPGFYLTTDFGTSCLYGAGSAQLNSCDVDVWEVHWKEEELGKGFGVPVDQQYSKIPQAYCRAPYDYLWNAGEGDPPTQYKINEHAYAKVRLLNPQRMTVDEAMNKADEAVAKSKPSEKKASTIKVKADGDCFFYGIAYHVKATELERAAFTADSSKVFGSTEAEQKQAATVRREMADWLAKEIFNKKPDKIGDNEAPATENGRKYLATWNLLTKQGTDTSHFGSNLAETIRNLPLDHAAATKEKKDLIWGDAGLFWRAIVALYKRRLLVHHGGKVAATFGNGGGDPIHVVFRGAHYEILRL